MSNEAFNKAAQSENALNEKLIEAVRVSGCPRGKVFGLMMTGADVNARGSKPGEEGWTPMMYAIVRGNEEVLKLLLHYSANPNIQNDEGDTAVMVAIKHFKGFDTLRLARQIIREYEEEGWIDLNIQNKKGQTALMLAAEAGRHGFVDRLMDAGANPFLRDNEGKWVLDYARAQKDMASDDAQLVLQTFEKLDADYRKSIAEGMPAERDFKVRKPISFRK